jgi:diaminohydroxyphosphoribosylaminopyrimidine deaminase/5-amino-6-(5-phosphoribosylamino)uracil reductase
MQRCFELARLGAGNVAPNPLVGAVLVHDGRIIGEGWHQRYGQAHAEVNAVNGVREADRHLIERATLYVSLEPCNVFGKTPPCTDLVLRCKIPRVFISCLDQTPEVSGRGVEKLREAGVEVITGISTREGARISQVRNTFVTKKRPFVLLKFARSRDGFLGRGGEPVWISNAFSKRLVHRLRSEYSAILVGTRTALTDNPQLTARLWPGNSPLRILLDRRLQVPDSYHLLSDGSPTLVVTQAELPSASPSPAVRYHRLDFDEQLLPALMDFLFRCDISSLMVEGGAETLGHFIGQEIWDEALVLEGAGILGGGICAPALGGAPAEEYRLGSDRLLLYRRGQG